MWVHPTGLGRFTINLPSGIKTRNLQFQNVVWLTHLVCYIFYSEAWNVLPKRLIWDWRIIPDFIMSAKYQGWCVFCQWGDDSSIARAFNNIDPHTDGTTCCTTCLWPSHTSLCLNPKINPLAPCLVQHQCTVYLVIKSTNHSIIALINGYLINEHVINSQCNFE